MGWVITRRTVLVTMVTFTSLSDTCDWDGPVCSVSVENLGQCLYNVTMVTREHATHQWGPIVWSSRNSRSMGLIGMVIVQVLVFIGINIDGYIWLLYCTCFYQDYSIV